MNYNKGQLGQKAKQYGFVQDTIPVIDCNQGHVFPFVSEEHFGSLFYHTNDI